MFRRIQMNPIFRTGGDDVLTVEVGTTQIGGEGFEVTWKLATAGWTAADSGIKIRQV